MNSVKRDRITGLALAAVLSISLGATACSAQPPSLPATDAHASLLVTVDPHNPDSRSQVVVALSMASQFHVRGLEVIFVPVDPYPGTVEDWTNLTSDWGLEGRGVRVLGLPGDPDNSVGTLGRSGDIASLRDASGAVRTHWRTYAPAQEIAPAIAFVLEETGEKDMPTPHSSPGGAS